MEKEIKIPKISEDADTGVVAEIYVSEGDAIEEGQDIIALDSDKASVDVPADASGKVKSIELKEGDEVKVGDVILILETENGRDQEDNGQAAKDQKEKEEKKQTAGDGKKRPEKESSASSEKKEEEARESKPKAAEAAAKADDDGEEAPERKEETAPVDAPAAPLAKKFARELGIDLRELQSDDPEERITREDVMNYAREIITARSSRQKTTEADHEAKPQGLRPIELPDFSAYGETERQPLSGIRSAIAENTLASWQNIPHVTHHDQADLAQLEPFLQARKEAGEQLSLTAVLAKISAEALQRFPKFNAVLDLERREIVFKKYYHIGIAVDTEDGLLTPVVRNVDQKNIDALSEEVSELAEKARRRQLKKKEMQGGNLIVSNLGGIGGASFTPVIFPGQAAILGVSTARTEAVYNGDEFVPKRMLPLSLSYDHRLIDGAEAARFLRWICEVIAQPLKLLESK